MGLDRVNQFEREGVLPFALSLFHITKVIDASFMSMTSIPPLWNEQWEENLNTRGADCLATYSSKAAT